MQKNVEYLLNAGIKDTLFFRRLVDVAGINYRYHLLRPGDLIEGRPNSGRRSGGVYETNGAENRRLDSRGKIDRVKIQGRRHGSGIVGRPVRIARSAAV